MSDVLSPEQFASGLKTQWLACRELGHLWKPYTVQVIHTGSQRRGRARGYVRTMKCRQCTSFRVQVLDSRACVLSNSYRYAEGYLATGVEVGVSRDVFRLEAVTRFIEEDAGSVSHENADGAPAPLLRLVS